MQPNLPDKKQVMDALLMQASSVFVHIDPRKSKVVVPPQFRKQPLLVLEIGMNMRVPIPDLEIDDEGIGCTLSFGGRPYWCRMPWGAVFALVSNEQRGMVWPSDVPAEVAQRFIPPPAAKKSEPKPAGPRLVSVPTGEEHREPEQGEREQGEREQGEPEQGEPEQGEREQGEPAEADQDDEVRAPVLASVTKLASKKSGNQPHEAQTNADGNAAAVLEEPPEEPSDPPPKQRGRPSYLRVVK